MREDKKIHVFHFNSHGYNTFDLIDQMKREEYIEFHLTFLSSFSMENHRWEMKFLHYLKITNDDEP